MFPKLSKFGKTWLNLFYNNYLNISSKLYQEFLQDFEKRMSLKTPDFRKGVFT